MGCILEHKRVFLRILFVKTKYSDLSDFYFGDFCVILQSFVRYNEQSIERHTFALRKEMKTKDRWIMLGKRVKKLRMERGLSLSELAEAAGVAKSYLSTIERDIHSNPSVHVLDKIAVALGVSLKLLIQPDTPEPESEPAPDPTMAQEWYALFHDALNCGISPKELKSMIDFLKWQVDQSKKEEE
jgi:XRE family transcriptional regulator of biofilm formation